MRISKTQKAKTWQNQHFIYYWFLCWDPGFFFKHLSLNVFIFNAKSSRFWNIFSLFLTSPLKFCHASCQIVCLKYKWTFMEKGFDIFLLEKPLICWLFYSFTWYVFLNLGHYFKKYFFHYMITACPVSFLCKHDHEKNAWIKCNYIE